MPDDTQIVAKPVPITEGSKPIVEESYILSHNLSGRFWITLIMALGVVFVTILIFSGLFKLESNIAIAIYTAFAASAFGVVNVYIGQNQKTKAQEGSSTNSITSGTQEK